MTENFDTSAALTVLDGMRDRLGALPLPSFEAAWDAAWIACLTNSQRWTMIAEHDFSETMIELSGVLRRANAPRSARQAWPGH